MRLVSSFDPHHLGQDHILLNLLYSRKEPQYQSDSGGSINNDGGRPSEVFERILTYGPVENKRALAAVITVSFRKSVCKIEDAFPHTVAYVM